MYDIHIHKLFLCLISYIFCKSLTGEFNSSTDILLLFFLAILGFFLFFIVFWAREFVIEKARVLQNIPIVKRFLGKAIDTIAENGRYQYDDPRVNFFIKKAAV